MLRITKATEPLNITTIVACIYGPPGVGKTSLASSANAPLLLDFDGGAHRSRYRHDTVQISSWQDIIGMQPDDLKPYKTVIIDTIGRALDLLSADIIRNNEKMGRNGSLTLQGYGELKGRFGQWLKYLRSFDLDVVIVAHADEKMNGDVLTERIDAQGASKNEVYKSADIMGRLSINGQGRLFNCNPTETSFGKNPVGFSVMTIPSLSDSPAYFGEIIQRAKDGMTQLSASNSESKDLIDMWKKILDSISTAEEFNKYLPQAKETRNKAVSAMMSNAAKKSGLKYDKKNNLFVTA